jgi:hypothetical protein
MPRYNWAASAGIITVFKPMRVTFAKRRLVPYYPNPFNVCLVPKLSSSKDWVRVGYLLLVGLQCSVESLEPMCVFRLVNGKRKKVTCSPSSPFTVNLLSLESNSKVIATACHFSYPQVASSLEGYATSRTASMGPPRIRRRMIPRSRVGR